MCPNKEREREREKAFPPLPLKEEFSLYQKLWDSLDYGEKVDKSDTKGRSLPLCPSEMVYIMEGHTC